MDVLMYICFIKISDLFRFTIQIWYIYDNSKIIDNMTAITPIQNLAPVFTFFKCEIFQSFQDCSEVEILFNLNGKKSKTSLSSKDVLNYLQKSGKYAHEGFAVDMDGNYYVKEYQVNGDHEGTVRIDLDAKIKTLSSKEWGLILTEAFKHVNPIHFHLYNI